MCAYLHRDVNLNSRPVISWFRCRPRGYVNLNSRPVISWFRCRPRGLEQSDWSVRTRAPLVGFVRLEAWQPTARGVRGVSAWRSSSRSVHIVHVVADQEHSDCAVPRYRYRTELVWRFVMPCMHCDAWSSECSFVNVHALKVRIFFRTYHQLVDQQKQMFRDSLESRLVRIRYFPRFVLALDESEGSLTSTVEYVLYAHGRCTLETRRRRGWAYNT